MGAEKVQDDLKTAVCMGAVEAVKKALSEKADVHADDQLSTGWLPIHSAASSGNVDVLNLLVAAKADVSARTSRKQQPIHLAAKEGDVPMLRRLTELEADVEAKNEQKKRAIHYACENGQAEAVKFLIDAGCDPLTPDRNRCTPCDYTKIAAEENIGAVEEIRKMLAKVKCDKSGGGLINIQNPKHKKVSGIVTKVAEEVNAPAAWWWDPELGTATDLARVQGSTHPNLPPAP